ncbi:hypothetical protein ROHU_032571 [Labeo rohita]|uniref:Uncharacterized protein n=1 Tax=Labeo rohita TaxID=84645 RepID=A0A498LNP1_LABRO|nr:hypothetical protein ROHU_032571 [Labeo rohita]
MERENEMIRHTGKCACAVPLLFSPSSGAGKEEVMEGERRYEDGIAVESVQRRFPEELVRYPSRTLCSRLADAQSGNVHSRRIWFSARAADGTQTLRKKDQT